MAYTYKRSAIIIASPRQQCVRSSGPVRDQVPEFVGASDGLNPMAGDMSGAFSRFFGQLQSQIGQVADARAMADKERERDINAEAKRQAVADAQRSFMNEKNKGKSATDLLSTMPSSVVISGDTIDTSQRPSYSDTYATTLGSLTGTRAYNGFISQLQANRTAPEQAEAAAAAYWTANFGKGTGNAYHDAHAQKVWTDNIQRWQQDNRGEVNKRANAKLLLSTQDKIYERALDGNFTRAEWNESVLDLKRGDPRLTDGQARGGVLSQWIAASSTTDSHARKLSAFILQPNYDADDGSRSQSLFEQFPKEMAIHLNNLNTKAAQYTTLAGGKAVSRVNSIFEAVKVLPTTTVSEFNNKEASFYALNLEVAKLENTPGTSSSTVAKLRAEISTAQTKFRRDRLNVNMFGQAAAKGDRLTLSEEDLKKAGDIFVSRFDILNNPDQAAKAGVGLRNIYLNNSGFFPERAVDIVKQGLMSSKPDVMMNTIKFLNSVDPDRNWFADKHLKDSPLALVKYQAYTTAGINPQAVHQVFEGENFRNAFGQIDMKAIVWGSDIDDFKKDQHKAKVEEEFFGDGVGNSLGARVMDTWENVFQFGLGHQWKLSPTVRKYALDLAPVLAAKHLATTGEVISLDKLKNTVAEHLKMITVPTGDDFIDFNKERVRPGERYVIGKNDKGEPIFGRPKVKYGWSVVNWEGKVENTVKNMWDAVKMIEDDSIIGLTTKGGKSVSLITRSVPALQNKNQRLVFDKNAQNPLMLLVNEELKVQRVINPDTKQPYSAWTKFSPFHTGYTDTTAKFTGNPSVDKNTAAKFLHPSINLVPVHQVATDDTTPVIGYYLSVNPFFKDLSDKFLAKDALQALLGKRGPLVPKKKLTPFQQKMKDDPAPEWMKSFAIGSAVR